MTLTNYQANECSQVSWDLPQAMRGLDLCACYVVETNKVYNWKGEGRDNWNWNCI